MGQVLVLELMSPLIWGNFNVIKHEEVVFIYWFVFFEQNNWKKYEVRTCVLNLAIPSGSEGLYPTAKNKRLIFMRQYNRKLF